MLGQNIKFLRTTKGLSQDGLCEEINNLFPSTAKFYKGRLSKWERSIEEPKLSAVKMIADYFKVTVDDLANKDLSIENFDTNTTNILPIYKQLETPRQTKVYSYAEKQLEEQNGAKKYGFQNERLNYSFDDIQDYMVAEPSVPMHGFTAANPSEITYGDPIYGESITKDVPKNADGALTIHGNSMSPEYEDGDIVFYRYQPDVENGQIAIVEIDGNGVTCKKVIKEQNRLLLRSLNEKYPDREVKTDRIRILGKVVK